MGLSLVQVLLRDGSPGHAMLARLQLDATGPVTGFIIREDPKHLATLPAEPQIQVRAGMFPESDVLACAVLAEVSGIDCLYETWLNYHNPAHRLCLEDLAGQTTLPFCFYIDKEEPARIVYLPRNPLSGFARQTLERAAATRPWSLERFDSARQKVQSHYPTARTLWETLGGGAVRADATTEQAGEAWLGEIVPCPQCGNEIPDFAVACPYCGAGIATIRSGYCPRCRAVVSVTATGACEKCGAGAKDVRVERSVAPEAAADAAAMEMPQDTQSAARPGPAYAQGLRPASSRSRKRSWLAWALPLAFLVLAGAGLGTYFGVTRDDTDAATVGSSSTISVRSTTSTSAAGGFSAEVTAATVDAMGGWAKLDAPRDVPAPRWGHSMVYDPNSRKVILFGGNCDDSAMNDTWAYDPATNTWTDLHPSGDVPEPRYYHSMAFYAPTREIILFGGAGYTSLRDTWAYDPAANTWTDLDPAGDVPAARWSFSMVFDSVTGRLVLFGGSDRQEGAWYDDTRAYDPAANTWTDLHPAGDVPVAREFHSMVFDSAVGRAILFGGGAPGDAFADTWAYDPAANAWADLEPGEQAEPPPLRLGHAMVYDSYAGRVILFGGLDPANQMALDDTWSYDPASNAWTKLNPAGELPEARTDHCMVYASDAGRVILFGGSDSTKEISFNDTWVYQD